MAGKRITYFDRPCSPRNSTITRFDARGRMMAAAGGRERGSEINGGGRGRERNDYEVKAGAAFNGRHKAALFPSGARAFETIVRAFFNARFIEIDYAHRGNRR